MRANLKYGPFNEALAVRGPVFVLLTACVLALVVVHTGCPRPPVPPDPATTVHLEVPGSQIVCRGEVYEGEADIPVESLVGIVYGDNAYLYHPAMGEVELSDEGSRRAVGYWIVGLEQKKLAQANAFGKTHTVSTGLEYEVGGATTYSFKNNKNRWAVVASGVAGQDPVFLAPSGGISFNLVTILREATTDGLLMGPERDVVVGESGLDTYGSVIRAAAVPGGLVLLSTGISEALEHDASLFIRLNAIDFVDLVFAGLRETGGLVTEECLDAAVVNTILGEFDVYALGVLTGDPGATDDLQAELSEEVIQSGTLCVCEFTGGGTGPCIVAGKVLDILCGLKWIVDDVGLGSLDALTNAVYAHVPGTNVVIPPEVVSFSINSGTSSSASRSVTLNNTCTGSPTQYMPSESSSFSGASWQTYSTAPSFTLSSGNGTKTVYFKVKNAAGESGTVSDTIMLNEGTAPSVTSFRINSSETTTSRTVTLNNTCTGSPTQYMASESSSFSGAAWQTYSTSPSFMLSSGNALKTVWFKVKNAAGESGTASDTITVNDGGTEETIMLPDSVPLEMVWIPGETFLMGRYPGEQDSYSNEDPRHSVTLPGFWMAKYELTKRQWQAVMRTTPWSGHNNVLDDLDSPAVYVSWNDAKSFVTALNTHTGLTFRLPSEAEWEYACRADTTTRFYWGDDPGYTAGNAYCWWRYNAWDVNARYAHVVGQKLVNGFGLYDMSGNVWEWCEDDWHSNYTGAPTDGSAWVDFPRDSDRAQRGGGWCSDGTDGRSASRYNYGYPSFTYDDIGFRLAR